MCFYFVCVCSVVRWNQQLNENTKVVSPDAGGVYRANRFRDGLKSLGVDAGLAMIVKVKHIIYVGESFINHALTEG